MAKKLIVDNPLDMGGSPPPEIVTMEQVASEMYGTLDLPISGAPKAKMVRLDEIETDKTQPRRVVPVRVRGDWRGDAGGVRDVIHRWHEMSEELLGEPINVRALINKRAPASADEQVVHGIVRDFLAVVKLAGDILRDGLINPITLIRLTGGGYKIETGERRWWAYQFLRVYVGGDKWDAIPATTSDKGQSVWRTAGENTNREELNGIAKARQLALIIMHLNDGVDGMKYDDYDFFERDLYFYAQVANGNIHRIPKDMAKAVQEAVGVTSDARVSQIRRVLRLDADTWDKADEEGWSEKDVRLHLQALEAQNNPPVETDTLTQFKVSESEIGLQNDAYHPQKPPSPPWTNAKNPPIPWGATPPPSIQSYDAGGRRVDAPVPLDDDDDVIMEGDGEAFINRPFADARPHDVDDVRRDTRYVGNGMLRQFIGFMVVWHRNNPRYCDDFVALRDFTPDALIEAKRNLSADEIAQMMTAWQDAVVGALGDISNELADVLAGIWKEVEGNG